MAVTEGAHRGEFLLQEASGTRSREEVTINANQTLSAGHVMAELSAGGWVEFDPAGSGGAEVPAGILWDNVTTAAAETKTAAMIVRDAEIAVSRLTWIATADAAQQTAALATLAASGLIGRS